MNTIFPIVSKEEIIDLFHTISYWRCLDKRERGIQPHLWFVTFDLVSKIMMMLGIIHEQRLLTLRENKEFSKKFLARVAIAQRIDCRNLTTILEEEKKLPFLVQISDRELVNGNRVNLRDLFALRRIFVTARGMAAGPIVERVTLRLVTHADYNKVWQEIITTPIPGVAFAAQRKRYAFWLDEEGER